MFSYSKIYHEAKRQQAQIQQLHHYAQTLSNVNADHCKSCDSLSGDSAKTVSTHVECGRSRACSTSTDKNGTRHRTSKPSESDSTATNKQKDSTSDVKTKPFRKVCFLSCYTRRLDESESTECIGCDECSDHGDDEFVVRFTRGLSYRTTSTMRTETSMMSLPGHHQHPVDEVFQEDHSNHTNKITFAEVEMFRNDHTHTSSCIGDELTDKLNRVMAGGGGGGDGFGDGGGGGGDDLLPPRRTFSMGDGYREHSRFPHNLLTPLSALDECQSKQQQQRLSEGANLSPMSALTVHDHNKQRHSEGSVLKKIRSFSRWSPATSPLMPRKCNKKASEQKRNEQKIRRFKKELRAAKVVALIMGTFLVCWTPFFVLIMCYAFHVEVPMRSIMICKLLHYTNSAINPILYVVLNKVYRSAVVKVMKKFKTYCLGFP